MVSPQLPRSLWVTWTMGGLHAPPSPPGSSLLPQITPSCLGSAHGAVDGSLGPLDHLDPKPPAGCIPDVNTAPILRETPGQLSL